MQYIKIIRSLHIIGAMALGLLLASQQTFAATQEQQTIKQLAEQVKALQHQLATVQTQLVSLQRQRQRRVRHRTYHQHHHYHRRAHHPKPHHHRAHAHDHDHDKGKPHVISKLDIGMPVYISPYIKGVNPRYDISALIINVSDINRDKNLLERRRHIVAILGSHHVIPPDTPTLALSGEVRGNGSFFRPFRGGFRSNIDFEDAKVDFLTQVNPWVIGFFTYAFDNGPGPSGNRVTNSRLLLDTGFITLGNFTRSPFYGTVGQLFVSFGRFHSNMISDSLPQLIGETKERAINVGYKHMGDSGPYLTVYAARGDTSTRGSRDRVNQGGADLGYLISTGLMNSEVGVSYIGNIADAQGIQNTGSRAPFRGFDRSPANQVLRRRIPALDAYAFIALGSYTLIGEYTGVTSSYSPQNLTFNDDGAKPRAFHVEADYAFKAWSKDSSIAISFDRSYQALAYNIPEKRYMLTLSSELFRNTVFSLEYRHDINYGKNDTAFGQGFRAFIPDELGRSSDSVIGQAVVYF